MLAMIDLAAPGRHWSFWLIGAVTLIYNLAGCANFIMQMNAEAVAAMPDAIRALIEQRPMWATAAFAIAVFGASLGCIVLLLRRSIARRVFIVSFAAAVLTLVDTMLRSAPTAAVIGNLVQLAVNAFLIEYARRAVGSQGET